MKGYITVNDLAKYLGRDFDDNQNAIADLAIGAAEIIIDRKTSVRFKESGPQTLTVYQPPSPLLRLTGTGPYTAIAVTGYPNFGSAGTLLTAGLQYEIRDATRGILWFPTPGDYYRIDIVYTPAVTVPDNIKMATSMLAAHYMRPILNDEIPGLSNYSVGGEFSVSFSQYVQQQGYPAEIDTLLGIPALYIA